MRLSRRLTVAAVGLAVAVAAVAAPRLPPRVALPAGKWRVEFANGVVETCEFQPDATAAVVEPARSADGTVATKNDEVVVTFADDRVERWTPAGKRMLVEHWCPASAFPAGKPVLGVAVADASAPADGRDSRRRK